MQQEKTLNVRSEALELEWTAIYNDGTTLEQQYGKGEWNEEKQAFSEEKHFGHIKQDKLKAFELKGPRGRYILDLETGVINANGTVIRFKHLDIPLDDERMQFRRRVIYFRRVRQDAGPEGIKITNRYLLGWQATVEGKNMQFILVIEPDGSLTFMNHR